MSPRKKIGFALLMISILLLAACTPAADAEPTPDTNMVYTQAAQTVAAQLEAQTTPEPTLDPNLIRTEAAQTVEASMADMATETPAAALATIAPLNTVAPLPVLSSPTAGIPATSAGNSAEWRGQWPTDGSSITIGNDTDIQWTLKNTGTKTWTTEYTYRFYIGDGQFHKYSSYVLPKEVLPGEEVTLTVDAKSNLGNGEYYELWVLTDEFGVNFSQFDVRFTVGGSSVPTSTPGTLSDSDYCCNHHAHIDTIDSRCQTWVQTTKGVDPLAQGTGAPWDYQDIEAACALP
jgi:Ig-like domain from next to BRCA1 gene